MAAYIMIIILGILLAAVGLRHALLCRERFHVFFMILRDASLYYIF